MTHRIRTEHGRTSEFWSEHATKGCATTSMILHDTIVLTSRITNNCFVSVCILYCKHTSCKICHFNCKGNILGVQPKLGLQNSQMIAETLAGSLSWNFVFLVVSIPFLMLVGGNQRNGRKPSDWMHLSYNQDLLQPSGHWGMGPNAAIHEKFKCDKTIVAGAKEFSALNAIRYKTLYCYHFYVYNPNQVLSAPPYCLVTGNQWHSRYHLPSILLVFLEMDWTCHVVSRGQKPVSETMERWKDKSSSGNPTEFCTSIPFPFHKEDLQKMEMPA